MANQEFYSRIIHKHDTEENWIKAVNFIPKQGEIIVYDIDNNYDYERLKVGDGITNVNVLPFVNEKPTEEDAMELLAEIDIVQPMTDENGALYVDENNTIYVI